MDSPCLLLPLNLLGRKETKALWLLNLGKFSFSTNELFLQKSCRKEDKIYDNYTLKLEEIRVLFLSSIEVLQKKAIDINEKDMFPLVKDIFLDVSLKKLKGAFINLDKDAAEMQVDILLNEIELNLNENLLREVIFLQNHFTSFDRKDFQSKIISRNKLNEIALLKGKIYKKGRLYQAWNEYYGMLTRGKIYLFENSWDLNYKTMIPVHNAIVSRAKGEVRNSLMVIFIIYSIF